LYVGTLSRGSAFVVASALALSLGAVIVWALAGKIVPSALFPDGGRFARLRSPVGYWNGLAFLAAVALVLGLWLATERARHVAARTPCAVLIYGAMVTVVLTYSRSGIAIAVLGALAWLALGGAALEMLAAMLLSLLVAAPVIGFALPGRFDR
jgi:hypothetical protein